MPTVTVSKPPAICPTGVHTFFLTEVKSVFQAPFGSPPDAEKTVERWVWEFTAKDIKDTEGLYPVVTVWTNTTYGDPRAGLTRLLDMLVPGITAEQAQNFDTDTLLMNEYEGSVKHEASKRDGTPFATFVYLRPLHLALEDAADPFVEDDPGSVIGCDVCGASLDETLIKNSEKRWGPDTHLCHKHGRERMAAEKVPVAA